jgi:hypothetical protein
VKGGLFLDVVVIQSATILELFSCENKTLLIRGDAGIISLTAYEKQAQNLPFLVLDLGLDIVDSIR